jgi:DNA-binding protein H-NS
MYKQVLEMLSESYKMKEEVKTENKDEENEMISEHENIEINNNNINTVNNLSEIQINEMISNNEKKIVHEKNENEIKVVPMPVYPG